MIAIPIAQAGGASGVPEEAVQIFFGLLILFVAGIAIIGGLVSLSIHKRQVKKGMGRRGRFVVGAIIGAGIVAGIVGLQGQL